MRTNTLYTPSVCRSFVCGGKMGSFLSNFNQTLSNRMDFFVEMTMNNWNQYVLHAICCALLAARSVPAMRCSRFSRRRTSNYHYNDEEREIAKKDGKHEQKKSTAKWWWSIGNNSKNNANNNTNQLDNINGQNLIVCSLQPPHTAHSIASEPHTHTHTYSSIDLFLYVYDMTRAHILQPTHTQLCVSSSIYWAFRSHGKCARVPKRLIFMI